MNHTGPIIDSPVAPDSDDKELAQQMIAVWCGDSTRPTPHLSDDTVRSWMRVRDFILGLEGTNG